MDSANSATPLLSVLSIGFRPYALISFYDYVHSALTKPQ